jgi:hypothetical protein
MCMALYIASDKPLPVIKQQKYPKDAISSPTWPQEAQRFYTAELRPERAAVRSHFRFPHVLYAGSYEGCGCGFNFAREYPDVEDDPKHLVVARESVAELVRYVRESGVRQIYSCSFDDEAKPTAHERTLRPEVLAAQDFFFREQELLSIDHDA